LFRCFEERRLLSRVAALCCLLTFGSICCASEPNSDPLPLQPKRKLQFDVTEGTWMSVNIDPGAQRIAFDLLGDIYTLEANGGDARLLLGGPAFESQPVYSPDGKRLAFISDRSGGENLWIVNADGSVPMQLSKDEDRTFASPAWSPDGQYVYVARSVPSYGLYEIWMYHVRGGSGVQITRANGAAPGAGTHMHAGADEETAVAVDVRPNTMGPAPSPDGKYLYYGLKLGGFEYNAEFPLWSIARRDLSTGAEDVFITAPGSAMRPVLSRDGKQLVYAARHNGQTGLRLRDLDSGEDRWLAYPVQRDEQEALPTRDVMPGYNFTPDGKALLLSYGGKIRRMDIATGQVSEIPFKAHVNLDIGPDLHVQQNKGGGPVRARVIQTPRPSPNGRTAVFSALGKLYLLDLQADATPRRLTSAVESEFHPNWSADGRWITYVTGSAKGGHIWKVRADGGSKPQRLTDVTGYYSDPLFSPDSKSVYALRSSNHDRMRAPSEVFFKRIADLIQVPAAGGKPALISHAPAARSPHLSADPQRLYFYSDAGLQSVRLDGSDRRVHVQIKGLGTAVQVDPIAATDVRLSPDGKWALALFASHVHLIAVPQTGDATLQINLTSPSVPHRKITRFGADYFDWADGGKTITWSLGSHLYRLPLERVAFNTPAAPAPEPESFNARIEVPRDIPSGTLVLRGATAITMKGDEVVENADVVIKDGRVIGVGPQGSVPFASDANIRDVSGRFITPGFVDTHAHWYEIRRGVLDLENWSFLINLAYGVTSGLDVQPFTSDMFVYEDMIDAGLMIGPRAYSTGPGMFSNNRLSNLQDALDLQSRYRDFYETRNLKSYVIGNRRQRQLVVGAAEQLGMMPTTEGALDFKLGLTHAIDGFAGHEHALPSVPLYEDVVQLFARTGISYTPTLLVTYGGPFAEENFHIAQSPLDDPKVNRFMPPFAQELHTRRHISFRRQDHVYPQLAAQAAKLLRAGGRIGVGSHGQFQGLGYHWELQALAEGGFTPVELLKIATLGSAEIIGRSAELGSLEAGKFADLLVLERDPRADIKNTLSIEQVMKNGRLYDGDTLDELWPRQRALPPLWFATDRPDALAH
jgi:Tol biopolymer transport system component